MRIDTKKEIEKDKSEEFESIKQFHSDSLILFPQNFIFIIFITIRSDYNRYYYHYINIYRVSHILWKFV